ncbi:MAG: catechol 2,3-dioxygenase-like lactoylglutathione lyase family enzyme [Halieaceae bacterium]|jgi:catechol 2,3-dioxygenase-like lactoylglutathione lyase family enzyme
MTIRMEHANLHVRHFDEALRFLKTAFPEFQVRSESISDGRRWMHIGTDETYIALHETELEKSPNLRPYNGKPGVNHIGYEVDDVDALAQRLAAAGFKDSTYPNNHPHRKRVYFYDADGNDWEFVQYFTDDAILRNDYDLPD